MANLSEQESWIDGIYQLETSDPVVAGPGGISNRQAEQLASRTAYLKKMQETTGDSLQKHLAASDPHSQYAPKVSPAFTGTPTAPTTAQTANNTQIATTAFVKSAISALVNGSPATLDTLQELAKALGNDPNFSTTVLSALAGKLGTTETAAAADKLITPRKINGTYFDGSADVNVDSDWSQIKNVPAASYEVAGVVALSSSVNDNSRTVAATAQMVFLARNIASNALAKANAALPADGTAVAATKLATARKINGVAFDGTADIALTSDNVGALPATGTAAAATKLATARTINGVAFDGTANISLTPASVGALPTAGTAAAATKLATARTINGVAFDGTANIALTPASVGALPTAGTAVAATKLATARKINGVAFDGTADINLSSDFPVGVPIPYPSATPPTGWIKCNGQSFNKSLYPILASLYPSGVLPDLRGEFVRGWDDGRGVDASRALLSAQGDAMQPITAKWVLDDQAAGDGINYPPSGAVYIDKTASVNYDAQSSHANGGARAVFDSSLQTRTANETRPRNIAFNYIVRAA